MPFMDIHKRMGLGTIQIPTDNGSYEMKLRQFLDELFTIESVKEVFEKYGARFTEVNDEKIYSESS